MSEAQVMETSALGSNLFFAFALVGIALATLLLLRYYLPLRTTPAYILLPVFLALALPASIILLVPIDLASTAVPEDGSARGIWLPERALLVAWRISYWLTFVLTWFILPLLGDYADSGHQDPKARMMYSLRVNARFQLILLGSTIAGLVYFIITSGFSIATLRALVMVLPYAFGLVIAIYLMGHGLVAIPRKLYKSAFVAKRLNSHYTRAPKIYNRLTEAVEELDQLEGQVLLLRQRKNGTARDFQEWIDELADTADIPEPRVTSVANPRAAGAAIPAVITERYLADLTRKLKRARHKRIRFIEEWDRLVRQAAADHAILDAAPLQQLEFDRSRSGNSWFERASFMTPQIRYLYHAKALPVLRLALAGTLAVASVCIVWSEVFKSAVPQLSIVGLSIIHHPNSEDGKIGFGGQIMATLWLLYMCTAALASVGEVKVWGNRALVKRHTYTESACWYSCQVAKLTVPLSYNFMTFTSKKLLEDTAFYHFLGQYLNMTTLGSGFSAFFPIFILLPVCATTFNLYGRVKSFAGFGVLEEQDEEEGPGPGTQRWRDGKALIDNELRGTTAFGLASRDQSPTPGQSTVRIPRYEDNPSTAPAGEGTGRLPRPVAAQEDAQEEGGLFQDFAHRVRNTIDTADRPEWLANVNIPRPKWMGGGAAGRESSGRADYGRGLGRWFGGRPDDGRLRL